MKEITDINNLVPLERVMPRHLKNLSDMMGDTMRRPIIADRETGRVLDGSHRYVYLLQNGYAQAPVIWVDYKDVIDMAGHTELPPYLYPPRTTRHKFPFIKKDIPTKLSDLKRMIPQNVEDLIEDVSIEHEIQDNTEFIGELTRAIEIGLDKISEDIDTRNYLQNQIRMMKRKALFPGKFNPPHIGHVKTILKLNELYDLTVGVTGDIPVDSVIDQDQIIDEIRELGVKVIKIDGVLIEKDDINYDIILSGNKEVIAWAYKIGKEAIHIPRSGTIHAGEIRRQSKGVLD